MIFSSIYYIYYTCFITAIDLFELSSLSDERIRTSQDIFFKERWKQHSNQRNVNNKASSESMSDEDKDIISNVLCRTLPSALNRLLHKDQLYLFNEHYVVKPPDSDLTFRWHRDADEQLQFCFDQHVEYYSLWCALDPVSEDNGTLQVPANTTIHTIDLAEYKNGHGTSVVASLTSDLVSHQTEDSPPESGSSSSLNIDLPRGSGVVFSSLLWHCSGPNNSHSPRRVLYAQYSDEIITSTSSSTTSASASASTSIQTETAAEGGISSPQSPAADEPPTKTTNRKRKRDPIPLCFAIPCDLVN
jgi:ectoine hydroxylase-related dioxygenase (phytanoyl-CoA dioxygenase family)